MSWPTDKPEQTFLSRDLVEAIRRRYGSLRRFHRERIGDRLSYYLFRLAAVGGLRPINQVETIEDAAAGLLNPEEVRGKLPDPPEELRLAARRLVDAARALEMTISTENLLRLRDVRLETERLCSL